MSKVNIKIFDVVDNTPLPVITVDQVPHEGDPLEINGEMYYICEKKCDQPDGHHEIGVIPLVVKNPSRVENIQSYIHCLSIAHRRIQFKKGENICDLEGCDEMVIS
jgi:hypothetical protein